MNNRTNVPWGVLLEQTLEETARGRQKLRKLPKLPKIAAIALSALLLTAAGYILYTYMVASISPVLGNVKGTLNGCEYESEAALIPRDVVNVSPSITNTGNVDMYAFIEVCIPYETVDGSVVELYDTNAASSWKEVKSTVEETYVSHVFAYESEENTLTSLESGSTTDVLFSSSEGSEYVLSVGPVGLLTEEQRSEVRKVEFHGYGCQTGRDIEGLTDIQAFEATLEEVKAAEATQGGAGL